MPKHVIHSNEIKIDPFLGKPDLSDALCHAELVTHGAIPPDAPLIAVDIWFTNLNNFRPAGRFADCQDCPFFNNGNCLCCIYNE